MLWLRSFRACRLSAISRDVGQSRYSYLPCRTVQPKLGDWRPDTFKNFARLSPLFLQNMTSEVNSFVSDQAALRCASIAASKAARTCA